MAASFRVTHPIHKCVDPESSRYALGSVMVVPGQSEHEVYLVATDGRYMTIVPEHGKADGIHLVPRSAFPTSLRKNNEVSTNGDGYWKGPKGAVFPPVRGRFPGVGAVLKSPSQHSIELIVNGDQIKKVCDAIGSAEGFISLFIEPPERPGDVVESPIVASGPHGYGVVMPTRPQKNYDARVVARSDYNKLSSLLPQGSVEPHPELATADAN